MKIKNLIRKILYVVFSHEFLSKLYFRIALGYNLNFDGPSTFNEKMQWYKLYYCPFNKNVITCADKYLMRNYLKEKGYDDIAVPLIGVWDDAKDIDWETLPNRFVIKCNHGCRYNIVCKNKNEINIKDIVYKLNKWLKEDFAIVNVEPHYSKIKPVIICEKYIADENDETIDYKIHCFNGEVKFIEVCSNRSIEGIANYNYYDISWNRLNYSKKESKFEAKKPNCLKKMLKIAKTISSDFPYVRVDFYEYNNNPLIGELTFVHGGGLSQSLTLEADKELGNMLELPKIN